MPIAYIVDRPRKLILETWIGEVHAVELATYWKRYLQDPDVLEIRRTIVDLLGAVIRFSSLDFQSLVQAIVLPVLKGRKWRTALVVNEPTQFGVSQQYQVFAESYSRDSIFASIEEAEKWIGAQPP